LIKASDWFTAAAERVGLALGMPPFLAGMTIVAVGTSLPDLATSVVAALRRQGENRAQQVTRDDEDDDERARRLQRREKEGEPDFRGLAAQDGHQRQDGRHRQILEQEDGERQTAEPRQHQPLLAQDLQHDGGRRERQRAAQDQGRGRLKAEQQCDAGYYRRG